MTLPRIGLTASFDPHSTARLKMCGVRLPYLEAIVEAGGTPIIIPLLKPGRWLHELYLELDGILIPGGGDIHPRFFGQELHPKTGLVCELRDEVEIELARSCASDKKPLLGICRGIQVINVALGGTLHQHIPDQTTGEVAHSRDFESVSLNEPIHDVSVEQNSILGTLMGSSSVPVNSFHHQAIDKSGKNLWPVASSSDKIIEGIELRNHPFYLGVQWHPELMWQQAGSAWIKLFRGFVEASRVSRARA